MKEAAKDTGSAKPRPRKSKKNPVLLAVLAAGLAGIVLIAASGPFKEGFKRSFSQVLQQTPSWREVSLPESGYVIQLPFDPELESKTEFKAGVGAIKLSSAKVKWRTRIFLAQSIKFPEALKNSLDVPGLLEDNLEGLRQDLKGELISKKPVRHGQHPGFEFKLRLPEVLGQKLYMAGKIYVIGAELCEIMAMTNLEDSFKDPEVNFFFSSFRLKSEKRGNVLPGAKPAAKAAVPFDDKLKNLPDRTFQLKNGETVIGKVELEDEVHYAVETADGSQKIIIKEDLAAEPA